MDNQGEDLTVITYEETGTDDYGDPEIAKTETSVQGLVQKRSGESQNIVSAVGEIVEADVNIYLRDTVDVDEPSDTPKASIIRRELTGNTYRVEVAFVENNGLINCACIRT